MAVPVRCVPLLLLLLCACDSENVSWAFVSNPGGSFGTTGGAVIVISFSSSSSSSSPLGSNGDWLRVDGFDQRGALSVFLPYVGDFAVLQRAGSVELRSPALSFDDGDGPRPGRFEADGATLDGRRRGDLRFHTAVHGSRSEPLRWRRGAVSDGPDGSPHRLG
jgi:hypothetical protein